MFERPGLKFVIRGITLVLVLPCSRFSSGFLTCREISCPWTQPHQMLPQWHLDAVSSCLKIFSVVGFSLHKFIRFRCNLKNSKCCAIWYVSEGMCWEGI